MLVRVENIKESSKKKFKLCSNDKTYKLNEILDLCTTEKQLKRSQCISVDDKNDVE